MNKIFYFNLATYSQTGGIENFNKTFLKALNSLAKVTSVSVYDKESNDSLENIDYKCFNKNKIKASLFILKNIYTVDKLIVAHLNLLPIAIIAKIMNPKLKIYLSIYGIEVWKKLPLIYRVFLSKINILSISTYTTDIFTSYNNIPKENIFYLPPDTNSNINKNFNNVYNNSNFNVLSVTRLDSDDSYKGVDNMLKSIPLLIEKIPNIKYTIIGKGNDKERLVKLSKDLNIEKYIEFKGFVDFIEAYYQYCDIFVLPSKGEGFGIVYIEAMKYEKPCIACDEGGQTDVVLDNKTGCLCKYDDINCLSERVIDLYIDKEKRINFGKNGYEHFIENFTFDKFRDRLKEILNDIK